MDPVIMFFYGLSVGLNTAVVMYAIWQMHKE